MHEIVLTLQTSKPNLTLTVAVSNPKIRPYTFIILDSKGGALCDKQMWKRREGDKKENGEYLQINV